MLIFLCFFSILALKEKKKYVLKFIKFDLRKMAWTVKVAPQKGKIWGAGVGELGILLIF